MADIQFGVSLRGTDLDHVIAIEVLGYDSVWTGEHMLFHGPVTDGLISLAAFAARTSRVKIGSAVNLLPLRPPVVVAKAVSTLDIISQGRFIFGVGVGGEFRKEFEACGVPHHERGRRANEAIEICRQLWTQDHVTYQGKIFRLHDVTMLPKPIQPGGPPIIVSGRSEAAIRRAARLGDGYMPYLFTPERYAESLKAIAGMASERARDMSRFTPYHFLFTAVGETHDEAYRVAVDQLSQRYKQPFENLAERYCALGTPKECVERIRHFVDAGARHFILSPLCAHEVLGQHLEIYAREILPQFR
ncbi:MAG TPA: LLM class flavin-dependent oxidoreductase [Candidatus Tectomicrobia bacterium]|nr:LLM class flavin-dependent oxidoreductase [Candidatus Tectomicrobia bacterium]